MFRNVTANSGLTYQGRTWGAAWGDVNNDGLPDVWVSKHNSHALVAGAQDVTLYLNLGGGRFRNVTDQRVDYLQKDFHGTSWADFDNDGDMDVGQTSGGIVTGGVTLYVNNGGQLQNESADRGLAATKNTVGRNITWFDYNNDGRLDIYLGADQVSTSGGSGGPATVLRQTAAHNFVDVRAAVGITVNSAMGPLLSDLNDDGRPELILTHYGVFSRIYDTSSTPFRNIQGRLLGSIDIPKFEDVAIADFNNDLLPDIFVTRHGLADEVAVNGRELRAYIDKGVQKGFSFETSGNLTFTFSRQDGTIHYDDIHVGRAGRNPISNDRNPTFQLLASDPANVGIMPHDTSAPGIYIGYNASAGEWQFEMVRGSKAARGFIIESTALIRNVDTQGFEYNPPAPPSQLLLNTGSGFVDRSAGSGIAAMSIYGNYATTGDFDNDGDVDIYVDQSGQASNRSNLLLENRGGQFVRIPGADGAGGATTGTGGAVTAVDYNRDGFLDIFLTNGVGEPPFIPLNNDGPLQLFRNEGNANHWIEMRLHGTQSNADGIGAKVTVTAGGTAQLREANGGQHIAGQNYPDLHFGLGQHQTINQLLVEWPSGARTVLRNVAADRVLNIVEGQGLAPSPADAADPMLFGMPDDGDLSMTPELSSDGADAGPAAEPSAAASGDDFGAIAAPDWLLG